MLTKEYFSQGEKYFSESAGEFVSIEEMAPQYALNALRKLAREFPDDLPGSTLAEALLGKITPDVEKCRESLNSWGKALVFTGPGGVSRGMARRRLRKAGAEKTHITPDEWMEGFAPVVSVKVRAR